MMALIKHVHLFIHASTYLTAKRGPKKNKLENKKKRKKKNFFSVAFFSRWAVAKGKTKKRHLNRIE